MKLYLDNISGYRNLLSSIIFLAVHDACEEPVNRKKPSKQFPSDDASSAIEFIFGDNRPYFETYMLCLDIDVTAFRSKLMSVMYSDDLGVNLYMVLPHNAKKSFRFNHSYWLQATSCYAGFMAGQGEK